jgi:uncharacterized protein DUF1259
MKSPLLLFMHFWANGDAVTLAKGLRAAIDKTNSKKSQQGDHNMRNGPRHQGALRKQ